MFFSFKTIRKQTKQMPLKINYYWIGWLLSILYGALLAPNDHSSSRSTGVYVKQLVFGSYNDIDTYIVSLFYLMGKYNIRFISNNFSRLSIRYMAIDLFDSIVD